MVEGFGNGIDPIQTIEGYRDVTSGPIDPIII